LPVELYPTYPDKTSINSEGISIPPPKLSVPKKAVLGMIGAYAGYTIMSYFASLSPQPILAFWMLVVSASIGILNPNDVWDLLRLSGLATYGIWYLGIALWQVVTVGGRFYALCWVLTASLKLCEIVTEGSITFVKSLGNRWWTESFIQVAAFFKWISGFCFNLLLGTPIWLWNGAQMLLVVVVWIISGILALAISSSLTFIGRAFSDEHFSRNHIFLTLVITVVLGIFSGWVLYQLKR
jgi:hypothetical protein